MILGQNGILENSKISVNKYNEAQKNELELLENANNYIGNIEEAAINIYVDDVRQKDIPTKDSNKIYAYYTSTNPNAGVLFDKNNWTMTMSGKVDGNTVINIYFYEKDNVNVVKKILNINENYENIDDFIKANSISIVENSFAIDYIMESNGEMARVLAECIDNLEFSKYTDQAKYDGNNTSSLNLSEGKYLLKLSCNISFYVQSLLVDNIEVEAISENVYLCSVKNNITVKWYCNYYGVPKYLTVSYKKI